MKDTSFLQLLVLLLWISCSPKNTSTLISGKVSESKKAKVFLFAGQSNMEGRANAADLSPEDLQRLDKVKDRIKFYYNHQEVSPLQLTTPKPYIQRKFNLEQSFGPELFFGIEIAEQYPDETFVFIKRSQGGTSLYGCWNPHWTVEKATLMKELNKPKLFQDFVNYANSILSDFSSNDYEISGMLWVQGEADSNLKKWGQVPANTYGENLRNLIKEARSNFNKPDMPFMLFQVGNGMVVEGMKETSSIYKNVFLIPQSQDKKSSDFYEKNPPPIGHYTAKSMKRIGEQFFKVYMSFRE